ncbi:protein of unknown function [Nitrospina watsonii]|uniref:Uncharacterized protein n=1 Tax=Nitrospina watsonii TaxID=1323948 RepID=A0ABM9HFW8_9BACT|nr:protein of unknown function [Nitrospina watsonii]
MVFMGHTSPGCRPLGQPERDTDFLAIYGIIRANPTTNFSCLIVKTDKSAMVQVSGKSLF